MPDFRSIALKMIEGNPNIQNTPMNREIINAIRNNDAQAGMTIANNLCKTYGQDPQKVSQDAQRFFNFL